MNHMRFAHTLPFEALRFFLFICRYGMVGMSGWGDSGIVEDSAFFAFSGGVCSFLASFFLSLFFFLLLARNLQPLVLCALLCEAQFEFAVLAGN